MGVIRAMPQNKKGERKKIRKRAWNGIEQSKENQKQKVKKNIAAYYKWTGMEWKRMQEIEESDTTKWHSFTTNQLQS